MTFASAKHMTIIKHGARPPNNQYSLEVSKECFPSVYIIYLLIWWSECIKALGTNRVYDAGTALLIYMNAAVAERNSEKLNEQTNYG